MPVTLSIKNAPDEVVARLRARAARNHRSLQGELMAIIESAAAEPGAPDLATLRARVRALGLSSGSGESAAIIRAARDNRYGD